MEEPSQSLPPPAEQLEATRRGLWRWVAAMVGFVGAAALVGGLLFRVPYVALVPGTARDTENLVEATGIDTYPSEGELLFTTVRVRQRPNLWEYLWLLTRDDAEILPEDLVFEGRSADENRQFNLALMNDSKQVAIAVALEELGYDAIRASGVVVAEVQAGTAADGRLELGDTMVAIDDVPLRVTRDLIEVLGDRSPGDEITIRVESFGEPEQRATREVTVVLGARDGEPGSAFLGVGPRDGFELNDDFGFEIEIDSGSVGGPSAGLAFTLAVLDQLTEGELTGGARVAVTGTIDATGHVGPVGGVVQKTAAVREMGADLFLIPAGLSDGEMFQIRERAGDELEVVAVDTLDDALNALAILGGEVTAVEEFAAGNLS